MGTLAIVEVPTGQVVLGDAVRRLSEAHVRLDRSVASGSGDSASIWIRGADEADVAAAFETDETVTTYTRVAEEDGAVLYDVTFPPDAPSVRRTVCGCDGVIQESYTDGRVWTLHLRFPSRKHLSRAKEKLDAEGIEMAVVRIHDADGTSQTAVGLTDSQREALKAALKAGYYEVPREVGLQALADELGESPPSLSETLRRAHGTVVESTVTRECGSDAEG